MSKQKEHSERAFLPGNLVYGIELTESTAKDWQNLLKNGITTPRALQKNSNTPDWICTTLLSGLNLPNRYTIGGHKGPIREDQSRFKIGIILFREKLLHSYPSQIFAIGECFWVEEWRNEWARYVDFNPDFTSVYGIPIKMVPGEPSWGTEVRIYPNDPMQASVKPDMWAGISIARGYYPVLETWTKGVQPVRQIPVFTTQCELITPALGDS